MPYTPQQKKDAIEHLLLNGGDVDKTSTEMNIRKATLRRWMKDAPSVLEYLQTYMSAHALTLAKDLLQDGQSTPLNQRASALGMLVDRLLKFDALKPPTESHTRSTVEIIYRDQQGGTATEPDWRREGSDHAHDD